VLIVGLAIRLTIRDAIPYLSVIFYATPVIVLALAALILSTNSLLSRRWRTATAWLFLCCFLFGWWHYRVHASHPKHPAAGNTPADKKILFWNISYVDAGWPAIIAELQKHDADVMALVEVGPGYPHILEPLKRAFPEHHFFWAGHAIYLGRCEWELREWGSMKRNGNYAVVRAHFPDGLKLDTVVVDIHGFILMPRGPAIRYLCDVLARHTSEPVCLMGDFNTPPDSVFFKPIRDRFENAFEAAGNGYYVTWPTIAPVLALDQIWLPPGASVSSGLTTTPLSDHRLVTVAARFGTRSRTNEVNSSRAGE
jgi:endonuclease/exonuclease/phosphatase (EEP) superfamily protein YafD